MRLFTLVPAAAPQPGYAVINESVLSAEDEKIVLSAARNLACRLGLNPEVVTGIRAYVGVEPSSRLSITAISSSGEGIRVRLFWGSRLSVAAQSFWDEFPKA